MTGAVPDRLAPLVMGHIVDTGATVASGYSGAYGLMAGGSGPASMNSGTAVNGQR
ncbi:hypothetical protein [Streptomyces sclerotialus]|uniref:hypothetical protein n=1 Tax=Streptomyces sclerotialus TaxID=1957 RepID=UPI000AA66DD2